MGGNLRPLPVIPAKAGIHYQAFTEISRAQPGAYLSDPWNGCRLRAGMTGSGV